MFILCGERLIARYAPIMGETTIRVPGRKPCELPELRSLETRLQAGDVRLRDQAFPKSERPEWLLPSGAKRNARRLLEEKGRPLWYFRHTQLRTDPTMEYKRIHSRSFATDSGESKIQWQK